MVNISHNSTYCFNISHNSTYRFYSNESTKRNSIKNRKKRILDEFWKDYYAKLSSIESKHSYEYEDIVITLLETAKQCLSKENKRKLTENESFYLQRRIEGYTLNFDKGKILDSNPSFAKLLIKENDATAQEFLLNRLKEEDFGFIKNFDTYTIEAIIIHVLGQLFSCMGDYPAVRLSTLIESLDKEVRFQASMLNSLVVKEKGTYEIGVELVSFLTERKLITLSRISEKRSVASNKNSEGTTTKDKDSSLYVFCNFDFSLLPIKESLPMLCRPLDWKVYSNEARSLDDIRGAYLCNATAAKYNKLSQSRNLDLYNFNIEFNDGSGELCDTINNLQSQVFEINRCFLNFFEYNWDQLVETGMLMPSILAHVNLFAAEDLLRSSYLNNEAVQNATDYDILVRELHVRVQRARYEDFLIKISYAYSGFEFYLPAFMDFRGTIQRPGGIPKFYERDLAQSLFLFKERNPIHKEWIKSIYDTIRCALPFKYKKFSSINDAYRWFVNHFERKTYSHSNLINFAVNANDPIQFLGMILSRENFNELSSQIPITQDASESAYQILSYLVLNKEMARLTNLHPSPDGKIQDLYTFLCDELKTDLSNKCKPTTYSIFTKLLTRKLAKSLFMPMISGRRKALSSMHATIEAVSGSLLQKDECKDLAKHCFSFWNNQFPDIANFIDMIGLIASLCTLLDKPVKYSVDYFTTVQEYKVTKKEEVSVYDRNNNKSLRETVEVFTSKRDKQKTNERTCINFIHQIDSFIAIRVLKLFYQQIGGPIHTIHNNFNTTPLYARFIPYLYTNSFLTMGTPIAKINSFINLNLIQPYFPYYMCMNVNDFRNLHLLIETDYDEDWLWRKPSYNRYYWIDKLPIPEEHLKYILSSVMHIETKKNKNFNIKQWNNRVHRLLEFYNTYIKHICGNNTTTHDNNTTTHDNTILRWNEFMTLIESWDDLKNNYCLHF